MATFAYPTLPHLAPVLPGSANKLLTPDQQLENLLTVVNWVVSNPETLNMHSYHTSAEGREISARFLPIDQLMIVAHGCGTVHCLAGHAIAMAGEDGFKAIQRGMQHDIGSELLGLPAECFAGDLKEVPGSLQRFLAGMPYASAEAALKTCAEEILAAVPFEE